MTNAPGDLLAFRTTVRAKTGITNPASIGIVGDPAHEASGGYHVGRSALIRIGKFNPARPAGDSREDFSARLARDRAALSEDGSAMDIGYGWPHGGNAAWLRFNRLLVAQLRAGDPDLRPIRAVNYSPDGSAKLRVDREHGFAAESSKDTVDVHTHIEWYRDTIGRREGSFDRLAEFIDAAIANRTPPILEGASMAGSGITMSWGESLDAYLHRIEQLWVPAAQAAVAGAADAKATRIAIEALVTAINAGGGSVDSAAIIAHMDQLAAAELARDQAELQAVQAQLSPAEAAQLGQH